jgi:hypothetical protein
MIQVNGNALGFDEVVDTLDDALIVVEKVSEAIADGIGLSDIGTLIDITPRLNEIRKDAAVFAAQIADLQPEESDLVAQQLVARRGGSKSNIIQKALEALTLSGRWHGTVAEVVDLTQETIGFAKSFVKKGDPADA